MSVMAKGIVRIKTTTVMQWVHALNCTMRAVVWKTERGKANLEIQMYQTQGPVVFSA